MKICFHLCRYQNQNFSLVLHSCRSISNCVALMSLVSGTRVVKCQNDAENFIGQKYFRYSKKSVKIMIFSTRKLFSLKKYIWFKEAIPIAS